MKRTGTSISDKHILISEYKRYDIMLAVEGKPSDRRLQEIDNLLDALLDEEFKLYKIKYLSIVERR